MRTVFFFLLAALSAQAQFIQRNILTFSGGVARQVNGYAYQDSAAVGLGGTYGFRIFRNMDLEGGFFAALNPFPPDCNASGCYNGDNRFLWAPFGVRLVLPLRRDRLELSIGGGGLYEKYSVSNPNLAFGQPSYSAWGGYFAAGGRIALDHGRHFWLGATPRFFLTNGTGFGTRDRWFLITGDFSFRF